MTKSVAKSPKISNPAITGSDLRLRDRLMRLYGALLAYFGHRNWWPGETPFEVVIGAILTQNTSWANVEKAIWNLKREEIFTPEAILSLPDEKLAVLIRPSGYYNQKARRLKTITRWFIERESHHPDKADDISTDALREQLLALNGVGDETADSILLYACGRTVFVVDAYTRRIMSRLGYCAADVKYSELQRLFCDNLPSDRLLYNDFHAQFVALGKDHCRPKPHCDACPVRDFCAFERETITT